MSDDWWAVILGLAIVLLAVPSYLGLFPLGWVPTANSWTSIGAALSTKWAGSSWGYLVALFFGLAVLLAAPMRSGHARGWFKGYSVIFAVTWAIWILSNYAPVIKLVGSAEVGYIVALLAGMFLTNITKLPAWLKNAARGELFIKIAIVLLGAKILLTTFVTSAAPTLAVVLLSFPLVWFAAFFISRRVGLDREMSATLSSGVGVCGVSASVATAAAIDAPPIYSTLMSSIIVIFSAIEIAVMPFIAAQVFPSASQAAGVWMGLSVKTDGAASASGSIVDGLLSANGASLAAAVQTKVLIDVWIGLIAFLLATYWAHKLKKSTVASRNRLTLLWGRFPRFVLGYFAAGMIVSAIALSYPTVGAGAKAVAPIASAGTDPLRVVFFMFTFFSIGLGTRFSRFREVGIGRPALVYTICLLIAIVWGGVLSYLFFG